MERGEVGGEVGDQLDSTMKQCKEGLRLLLITIILKS
jgi:hypothetical protein